MSIIKNPHSFTVGTDVEFIIRCGKKLVKAGDYVDVESNLFSRDAYYKTFELKPDYSKEPIDIINSIKKCLEFGVNSYNELGLPDYRWEAGSFILNCPLGAHFHIGHKKGLIKPSDMAPFLDNYIGSISLLLENRIAGIKRRSYNRNGYSYGKMGDIREKLNKDISHYEYRTCSSGCLNTPHIMMAFLCLTKIIVHEVLNNKSFKGNSYVGYDDFLQINKDKIREVFDRIWLDISNMNLYSKYEKYLSIIPFMVENKLIWETKPDIKKNWGIKPVENY